MMMSQHGLQILPVDIFALYLNTDLPVDNFAMYLN